MTRKFSDDDLEVRRDSIVRAATTVFLRYGYAKTSMGNLAEAAKLSRPSLYEAFDGKEELFGAVIRRLNGDALAKMRAVLPLHRTLRLKLSYACKEWGTHGIRLIEKHPDAKDLFNFQNPAVREMYEAFVEFLVKIIDTSDYVADVPLKKIVRNLVYSMTGLLNAAGSVREMEELIEVQVNVFFNSLRPPSR